MMINRRFSGFCAIAAAVFVLVGCGGGGGDGGGSSSGSNAPSAASQVSTVATPQVAPSAQAPSDNSIKRGFVNGMNICYANSALKFMIGSIGASNLVDHLNNFIDEKMTANTGLAEVDAALKLIELINAAYLDGDEAVTENVAFLQALQKTNTFSDVNGDGSFKFRTTGVQEDSGEFLTKLEAVFDIGSIKGGSFFYFRKYFDLDYHRRRIGRDSEAMPKFDLNVYKKFNSLQKIVDAMNVEQKISDYKWNDDENDRVAVLQVNSFAVADVNDFKRIAISVISNDVYGNKVVGRLSGIDIDAVVKLPVFDDATQAKMIATLEAREVVVHYGATVNGGHYVAYLKNNDDKWMTHNDDKVTKGGWDSANGDPRLINFVVTKIEPAAQ